MERLGLINTQHLRGRCICQPIAYNPQSPDMLSSISTMAPTSDATMMYLEAMDTVSEKMTSERPYDLLSKVFNHSISA